MNRKPSLPMAWLGVLLLGLTLAPLSPAKEIRELDFKTLKSYEAKVQQLARDAIPATVAILNTEGPHRGASGSGVIVDRNGLILTAGHVIQGATELQVIFPDGRGVEAKALGYNLNRDVGMAQITDPGPFPFVKMGKSEDLEPLDIVIALGHAGGFDALRTPPIRIGRVYKTDIMGGFTLTDCTLIGGDSGGPLFDLNGELVGIHSSIGMDLSQNRHAQMDAFERDWDKLKSGNTWGRLGNMFSGDKNPDQPVLGVAMNRDSLVIEDVAPGSPAQKADLQAGDRIVKFEGNRVKNYRHFLNMIGKSSTQDGVDLVVERNGKQLSQTVQLMTRAELFSESKPAPSDDDGEKPGEVARGISGFLEQLFGQNEGRKAPFDLDPDNIDNLLEESGLDELFSGPNNPLEMFKQMGGNPGQMQEMLEEMTIKKDRQEALNKQFEDLVDAHRPAMGDLSESTVRLLHRDRQVALGTVVHANGGVLSKASELAGKQISCLLPNGERAQAEVIKTFPKRDLALLKVVTDEPLKPVTNWSKKQPKDMVIGSFLAAPSPDPETQSVVAIGLVSASNQNLSKEKGFLGVGLESTNDGGVSISGVIEDSPAAAAGLKTGDRIVAVDGKSTRNMTEVMRAISSLAPDTTVSITVKRGDKEWNIQPRLTKRPTDGQGAPGARFQAMDQMSGRLSKVKGGFPSAIQHDLPIAPEECGGPIVDLNGEVLGINIARAGRIKSYAIPASEIRQLLNMDTSEVAESPAVDSEEDAPPPNRVQDSRSVSQLEKDFDEALKGVEEARRALKKATDALRREKQLQRQ